LERGGRSLVVFAGAVGDIDWIGPLKALVTDGRVRVLEIHRIDGEPAIGSEVGELLLEHGFAAGYKGPTFRG
jgi:hypothetical protein